MNNTLVPIIKETIELIKNKGLSNLTIGPTVDLILTIRDINEHLSVEEKYNILLLFEVCRINISNDLTLNYLLNSCVSKFLTQNSNMPEAHNKCSCNKPKENQEFKPEKLYSTMFEKALDEHPIYIKE